MAALRSLFGGFGFFFLQECVCVCGIGQLQDGKHPFYSTSIFKNFDVNQFKLSYEM